MRSKQSNLFDKDTKKRYNRTSHGGAPTKGKRKLERPLSSKQWIHLVLKSDKAKGHMSFLNPKHKIFVEQLLKEKASKFGVRIADQVNVGNHVHLKIRIHSRELFQKFLKSVTTLIARKVTGARKGKPFGRFWQNLAYTRVLKSYIEELNLRGYFQANLVEASMGYEARERALKRFNKWVYEERGWASG
jgi:REP element-mobilizing transposase RayT